MDWEALRVFLISLGILEVMVVLALVVIYFRKYCSKGGWMEDWVKQRPHFALSIVVIALLLFALAPLPYGYYIFLRLVVCGVAIIVACISCSLEKEWPLWGLVPIALLFNPLIRVHLEREVWCWLDIITAVFFVIVVVLMREER